MITGKALGRRTFLRGHRSGGCASFPGCDDSGVRAKQGCDGAGAHGVRLCAERHRHAQLDSALRGQTHGAAAHAEAARAFQERHYCPWQSDAQQRAGAARRRGRSRPLLRRLSDRRSAAQDGGRYQVRVSRAIRSLRTRLATRRASRRSKWDLKTRARQATATRDIPARTRTISRGEAKHSRCRRFSIRARSLNVCSELAPLFTPEARARQAKFRRSILDFVTDDTKKLQANLGPTDQRKLDEYLSSIREIERQIDKAETDNAQIDPKHGKAVRRAGRFRRALQADDGHDHGRFPGGPDSRADVPGHARRYITCRIARLGFRTVTIRSRTIATIPR